MWNMYFESDCVYMVAGTIKIILELTKIVIHIRGCWTFFLPFSPVPLLFFFPHPYFPISPLISSLHLSFPSHVPTGQGYCHLSPPRSSRKRIVIYSFNRLFSVSSVLTVLTLLPVHTCLHLWTGTCLCFLKDIGFSWRDPWWQRLGHILDSLAFTDHNSESGNIRPTNYSLGETSCLGKQA